MSMKISENLYKSQLADTVTEKVHSLFDDL